MVCDGAAWVSGMTVTVREAPGPAGETLLVLSAPGLFSRSPLGDLRLARGLKEHLYPMTPQSVSPAETGPSSPATHSICPGLSGGPAGITPWAPPWRISPLLPRAHFTTLEVSCLSSLLKLQSRHLLCPQAGAESSLRWFLHHPRPGGDLSPLTWTVTTDFLASGRGRR